MDIAQSDRESLSFKPEAVFGTVSGTGNNYGLRMNGEQLKYNLVTTKSEEIIDDRTVRDVIVVDADSGGPVPAEFSYGEYDWLIQAAALHGDLERRRHQRRGDRNRHDRHEQLHLHSRRRRVAVGACESGQWVRVSGAVNSGNNKLVQLTATPTATGFSVASGTFVAETGSTGVVVQGARFKNGAVKRSHSIERKNADLNAGTGLFECFRGQVADKWTMTYQPGQKIGQTYEFKGKDALPMSTGSALPARARLASPTPS
jgi:hypothetical protein